MLKTNNKRRTIGNKLYRNLVFMLLLMALLAIAGIICIQILKQTGNEIAVEYHELNAVQELRFSLNKISTPAYLSLNNETNVDYEDLEKPISLIYEKLSVCKQILTKSHSRKQIYRFENHLSKVEDMIGELKENQTDELNKSVIYKSINVEINIAMSELDELLQETEDEIDEFIITSKIAAHHSTITITSLTVLLIIISSFWGVRFVKKISGNIKLLAFSTEKVANGNLTINTEIKSNDEISDLGISFNRMIETLKKTTVSKNFFDNIIKSMIESLIVTDANGKIVLLNQASLDLLGYHERDLLNKKYNFFLSETGINDLEKNFLKRNNQKFVFNQELNYKSKIGEEIPVLLSCTMMRNTKNESLGIVFIAHDIRDKRQMEERIITARNEQIIAINEAQEKERLNIASEIHDGLGQILTGISFSIENDLLSNFIVDEDYKNQIIKIQEQLNNAIIESKSIAYNLIPITIRDFGLLVAVDNLVQNINDNEKLIIDFKAYNYSDRIDERLEKTLYRIIQEALNNILRHAEAKQVNIQLIKHSDTVSLVIEDDGKGFDFDELMRTPERIGIGLISMNERVTAFNGIISINSAINKGTEILIEIPCITKTH